MMLSLVARQRRFVALRRFARLETSAAVPPPDGAAATSTAPATAISCSRHGPEDRVVNLNVGGKAFVTLRSTLAHSRVLSDYIERAEANRELTKDGSVFVDRDPEHFSIILCHLRNKAEGLGYSLTYGVTSHRTTVRLPNGQDALSDLLLEARHYQLHDLTKYICKKYFVTAIFARLGVQNPFEALTRIFQALRGGAVLVGGGALLQGTSVVTTMSASSGGQEADGGLWTAVRRHFINV